MSGYLITVNPANQLHNNSMDYVAGDHSRVMLQPPVSGTDYVNASWVPGYSGDQAFIISQHPNNFSLEQFWHMVWQTDTRTIICLSAYGVSNTQVTPNKLSNDLGPEGGVTRVTRGGSVQGFRRRGEGQKYVRS